MQCMDRASLEEFLSQGLSLAEIGKRFGKHEATVAYWLKKHGLAAVNRDKHTAKGGLDQRDLEMLVDTGASLAEIAEKVGRSKATVRHWLGQYGLQTHAPPGAPSRPGVDQAQASGQAEPILECPQHGNVRHILEGRGYYRCRQCRIEAVVRRRRKVKRTLVAEAGGKCRLCGYSRCLAALEFHHVDPTTKKFGLSRRGARSIATLRCEARKCVLLCSNCHAEVEAGAAELP
jgi:transposase